VADVAQDRIDPDSPELIPAQLARILRRQIASGKLAPGRPIPSESALMAEHGISRGSVRRAVDRLRSEGLILTVRGKGSYVRKRPPST
jgi:GntR family transcriptional regulator